MRCARTLAVAPGTVIDQAYANREVKRSEPVNRGMLDAGAEALDRFNAVNESESESERHPSLPFRLKLLDGLHDAVLPRRDVDGRFSLTISDTQAWRDRMLPGLGQLTLLRYLRFADCLGFPAFDFDRVEALDSGNAGEEGAWS